MNGFASKLTGWLALLVGITSALAFITLLLFFVGLFWHIPFLSFMGSVNDTLNALAGIFSAVLATALHPKLGKLAPRSSPAILIGAWAGALAITYGSWLIVTGRSDVELSSYYFFFGNGLIGIWSWLLNRIARQRAVWPGRLTHWGSIGSVLMMVGLLGLYGILLGWDGSDYSPLLMITGLSYFGTGILYPVWCLRLGYWILSGQGDTGAAAKVKNLTPESEKT